MSKCITLFVFMVMVAAMVDGISTVNKEAILRNAVRRKRRQARIRAEESFREKHPIVFDSYGRVIRWPREPDDVECSRIGAGMVRGEGDGESSVAAASFSCEVTTWSERKFRSAEEEHLQRLIRLDKQVELDREAGSDSETDISNRRRKVENKKRCALYREWVKQFASSGEEGQRSFFKWLEREYADFGTLRRLPIRSPSQRKANKLYRHIALQIHPDKLPPKCRDDAMKEMMVAIMSNAEKVKACVKSPHTCARGEL